MELIKVHFLGTCYLQGCPGQKNSSWDQGWQLPNFFLGGLGGWVGFWVFVGGSMGIYPPTTQGFWVVVGSGSMPIHFLF